MRLSDIMAQAGLAGYAEIALVVFFVAFLVIVIAIFAPARRRDWERAGRMPLEDDTPQTPRQRPGDGHHD
jgi:cbb3-type cytochrome oxidase subunit 3